MLSLSCFYNSEDEIHVENAMEAIAAVFRMPMSAQAAMHVFSQIENEDNAKANRNTNANTNMETKTKTNTL